MQEQSTTDPLITLTLQDNSSATQTVTIHESLLRGSPQLASISPTQPLTEPFDTFEIIRKYLYLQPIDVATAPPDAALAAARWGLMELHDALFCLAGSARRWLGLLVGADANDDFKREFVRRFVGAVDREPGLLDGGFEDAVGDVRDMVRAAKVPTWPVLRKQGIVVEVVRALIRFGEGDYGARVLDVIMRGFGMVGAETVREVLEALEWESGYGEVLERCGGGWQGDAWRVLIGVRDRVQFGWDEIRLCMECSAMGRWETGRDVTICGSEARFTLSVESGKKGMGVGVRSVGDIAEGKKRVRVRVSVGGICSCVDDGVDVVAQEEVQLVTFSRVGGVGVRVLDAASLKEFAGKHKPLGCRVRICVRLLLLRDIHHEKQVHHSQLWQMINRNP